MQTRNVLRKLSRVPPVVWMILCLIGINLVVAPGFFTFSNMRNIAVQASPLLVVSIGMTMVILTEGIDLSLGYVISLSGVVAALILQSGLSVWVAALAALATGMSFGLCNGLLVVKGKLPSFIATLGMGGVGYGIGLLLTNGRSIPALDATFRLLFRGTFLGVRMPIVVAALAFAVAFVFMHYTAYGRNVIGLGGNAEALRAAGINIDKAAVSVYVFSGIFGAVGGLMIAARTASGYAAAAEGWEFEAIAATIIGGSSFQEGRGNISRTILGVVLISVLRNGLNIAGVHNMYQFALIGGTVVTAIIIDVLFRRKLEM